MGQGWNGLAGDEDRFLMLAAMLDSSSAPPAGRVLTVRERWDFERGLLGERLGCRVLA
ncbi:hypothetical protein [Nonomuraea soli]|uniref:Uncharacterized protein n=1 Tax=Nonomuraea soli TaxID=1032476 RepID=A0A7W0CV30_9ACTN|nr:hypothetical protein [Nonomuraea soli]MBA2897762.1 hypothetical protein [Nonomuraea soli]